MFGVTLPKRSNTQFTALEAFVFSIMRTDGQLNLFGCGSALFARSSDSALAVMRRQMVAYLPYRPTRTHGV